MKWRPEVVIERGEADWLFDGKRRKKIAEEDRELANLLEKGSVRDDVLLAKVSEACDGDEISAGFRLAQFVEDYGYFLAEAEKAKVFG